MPELPEVETARRGITPHVLGQTVDTVLVRQRQLRWPVSTGVTRDWPGQQIEGVGRRGKYLLLRSGVGTAILHLGMSGSLRIVPVGKVPGKHDHIDVALGSGKALRFTDPRRFGALLWTRRDPLQHKLLATLGPEPLGDNFSGDQLYRKSRGRRGAVKNFIMDSHIVVGVGNIYASESLFRAGIHPQRAAGRVALNRYRKLAVHVQEVLSEAIEAGGTTLRDFVDGSGKPGYFSQKLKVYAREGEVCVRCKASIKRTVIGQRASYYCSNCQR